MTIEIIKHKTEDMFKLIDNILEVSDLENEDNIDSIKSNIKKVLLIFGEAEFRKNIKLMYEFGHLESFAFSDIVDMEMFFEKTHNRLNKLRQEIELSQFFKDGNKFDFKTLQKIWKERRLKLMFPNFNFKRYKELCVNPETTILNPMGEEILYDKFVVDKLILGIHQMIFSEMDFYMINVGKEGAGKSCWSSQILLYIYTFLKEVGLIEYTYDIKKMFFSSVESVLDSQDEQKNKEYFKIIVLDEAYDLNRNNFKDNNTKWYKDDMRSARKLLRVNILNLPQLGELDTSITLTRTNFIFYCTMDNDVKTGTLKKGIVEMYVFPRGEKIYSDYHKKNISDQDVQSSFNKMLSKKEDYYSGLPKDVMVKRFKFPNVWGFDKTEYDEHIKTENKKKRMKDFMKLTMAHQYIMFKKMPPLKDWGFDMNNKDDKKMYMTFSKMFAKVKQNFLLKPEWMHRMDVLYNQKR